MLQENVSSPDQERNSRLNIAVRFNKRRTRVQMGQMQH